MRPLRRVLLGCCVLGLLGGVAAWGRADSNGPSPQLPKLLGNLFPSSRAAGDASGPPAPAAEVIPAPAATPTEEAAGAQAESDPFAAPPAETPSGSTQGGASRPLRDPTQPGPQMREILGPAEGVLQQSPAALPSVPQLVLKGRVIPRDRPGAAILEVDGKLISVQKGSEATVSTGRTGLVTLRVLEIDVSAVRLEVLPQGQEVTLH